ncbi:MAG: ribosome biogenesis factor YjgA [Usitatibacter sp.]
MEEEDFISKTQRKRIAAEQQDVGAALVKLPLEQIEQMGLPEALLEAVLECKRLTTHEALRRQKQHIGKIMRNTDAAPIAAQLAALNAPSRKDTALFHLAEKWRQDMLDDAGKIDWFCAEFPGTSAAQLRSLVEQAKAERAAEKPPRKFRELFHVLNGIVNGQART